MKKIIFTVAIAILVMFAVPAMAADSYSNVGVASGTTVNTTWSGINGSFQLNGAMGNSGIANADIFVQNAANGAFSGSVGITTDATPKSTWNDGNIYATTSNVSTMFADGGMSSFSLNRNTGDTQQHYAGGGQNVYGSASSSDGSGQLSVQTLGTNYASLTARNVQIQADSADAFDIDSAGNLLAGFGIQYGISNGNNGASLFNAGTGSSQVSTATYSTAAYNGASSFTFGSGAGCHTSATANATGNGIFTVGATGTNYLNAPGFGMTLDGGGNFTTQANYTAGIGVTNFSVNGK